MVNVEMLNAVQQILEKDGSMKILKAQLKSSVVNALKERSDINAGLSTNARLQSYIQKEEGVAKLSLVADLLQSLGLHNSLSVFENECGFRSSSKSTTKLDRAAALKALGLSTRIRVDAPAPSSSSSSSSSQSAFDSVVAYACAAGQSEFGEGNAGRSGGASASARAHTPSASAAKPTGSPPDDLVSSVPPPTAETPRSLVRAAGRRARETPSPVSGGGVSNLMQPAQHNASPTSPASSESASSSSSPASPASSHHSSTPSGKPAEEGSPTSVYSGQKLFQGAALAVDGGRASMFSPGDSPPGGRRGDGEGGGGKETMAHKESGSAGAFGSTPPGKPRSPASLSQRGAGFQPVSPAPPGPAATSPPAGSSAAHSPASPSTLTSTSQAQLQSVFQKAEEGKLPSPSERDRSASGRKSPTQLLAPVVVSNPSASASSSPTAAAAHGRRSAEKLSPDSKHGDETAGVGAQHPITKLDKLLSVDTSTRGPLRGGRSGNLEPLSASSSASSSPATGAGAHREPSPPISPPGSGGRLGELAFTGKLGASGSGSGSAGRRSPQPQLDESVESIASINSSSFENSAGLSHSAGKTLSHSSNSSSSPLSADRLKSSGTGATTTHSKTQALRHEEHRLAPTRVVEVQQSQRERADARVQRTTGGNVGRSKRGWDGAGSSNTDFMFGESDSPQAAKGRGGSVNSPMNDSSGGGAALEESLQSLESSVASVSSPDAAHASSFSSASPSPGPAAKRQANLAAMPAVQGLQLRSAGSSAQSSPQTSPQSSPQATPPGDRDRDQRSSNSKAQPRSNRAETETETSTHTHTRSAEVTAETTGYEDEYGDEAFEVEEEEEVEEADTESSFANTNSPNPSPSHSQKQSQNQNQNQSQKQNLAGKTNAKPDRGQDQDQDSGSGVMEATSFDSDAGYSDYSPNVSTNAGYANRNAATASTSSAGPSRSSSSSSGAGGKASLFQATGVRSSRNAAGGDADESHTKSIVSEVVALEDLEESVASEDIDAFEVSAGGMSDSFSLLNESTQSQRSGGLGGKRGTVGAKRGGGGASRESLDDSHRSTGSLMSEGSHGMEFSVHDQEVSSASASNFEGYNFTAAALPPLKEDKRRPREAPKGGW